MPTESTVIRVHTLGPSGTNCEAAAYQWLEARRSGAGGVVLYSNLESAVDGVLAHPADSVLLACIVYPQLNEIVFQNLTKLALRECFVYPTHNMVLAATGPSAELRTIISHPAPINLLDDWDVTIKLADSNSAAAIACAGGAADACVTTSVAAERNDLMVLKDFGPVPMGFSIHAAHALELQQ
jgi:prephenate dehydratase